MLRCVWSSLQRISVNNNVSCNATNSGHVHDWRPAENNSVHSDLNDDISHTTMLLHTFQRSLLLWYHYRYHTWKTCVHCGKPKSRQQCQGNQTLTAWTYQLHLLCQSYCNVHKPQCCQNLPDTRAAQCAPLLQVGECGLGLASCYRLNHQTLLRNHSKLYWNIVLSLTWRAPHELFLKKVFLIYDYLAGRFFKENQLAGKV